MMRLARVLCPAIARAMPLAARPPPRRAAAPRPPRSAPPPDAPAPEDDATDILLTVDEDWEVPGGANDSLTSNTPLGRAVASACEELEVLADLEKDAADAATALLKKLGYTGALLDRSDAAPTESDDAGGA